MKHRLAFVLSLASVFTAPVVAADTGAQLGTIHFAVSGNEAARAHVVRGVKLLHHMTYTEAEREFTAAIAADADCALAYWGRAMTIVHPVWPDEPNAAEIKRGWDDVQAGLKRAKTPRERAYFSTLEAFFHEGANRTHAARLQAMDVAWMRVAAEFPEDLDAAAFSALFALGPVRYLPKDRSHRVQLAAGALVQKVLAKIPDHPGAQHYKIHAYDYPLLADRALEICDSYGTLAPGVPHALHMPTHIYTRRGLWAKSIDFNLRSAEAARKLAGSTGPTNQNYLHAFDYLAYAYLQRGQYREAEAVRAKVASLAGPFAGSNAAMAFALAAIPARYALERQAWDEAARLALRQPAAFPWTDAFPHCDSIGQFARAIGAARSGKLDIARAAIAELERLHGKLSAVQPTSYWTSQAETQLLAARGWVALKEGNATEAVAQMRRAAELEAAVDKEAVTPGEVLPAGEMLGDLLAELGRDREALVAYEAMLELTPNRFNSVHGAARSAERAGDAAKAARYYASLVELAVEADAGNERVEQARRFLAAKPQARAE